MTSVLLEKVPKLNKQSPESLLMMVMPIYIMEVDRSSTIEHVAFHENQNIEETAKWHVGVKLTDLYEEHPIFIHFLGQALSGKQTSSVLKLENHVFEVYFFPRETTSKLNGAIIFFKKIHELRQKNFELLASQQELQILKTQLAEQGGTSIGNADKLTKTIERIQDQLKQSEKMATLGMNLSSISHEIKNPVGFIYNSVHGLRSMFDELVSHLEHTSEVDELAEDMKLLLSDLEVGATRTLQLAKSLGVISRKDNDKKESVNINELIQSTILIIKHKINGNIVIEKDLDEKLDMYDCYAGQLGQVIMNLVSNAIDSIDTQTRDGIIRIQSKNGKDDIRIIIEDNGKGMSDEVRNNIFEPLFTTKDVEKGTGLGLSITKEIIDLHQGKILVQSKEGLGSKFTVILPKRDN